MYSLEIILKESLLFVIRWETGVYHKISTRKSPTASAAGLHKTGVFGKISGFTGNKILECAGF